MILSWVLLLCLSLVAAFPKGHPKGHANRLQVGSSTTGQSISHVGPVSTPRKHFALFKKLGQRFRPWRPSGSSSTAGQVTINPGKTWGLSGKGHQNVNVRPPPVLPLQPWVFPVHGHHPPTHRIIVLTGNNVISLNPKDSSSLGGKIMQLFLTSGNNGVSLHSSDGFLPHGSRKTSPELEDSKLHSGTAIKDVNLEIDLPGVKTSGELTIGGTVSGAVELVKGDDLVVEDHGVIGINQDIIKTVIVPSAILVEKVLEDSIELEAEKLGSILGFEVVAEENLEDIEELLEFESQLEDIKEHSHTKAVASGADQLEMDIVNLDSDLGVAFVVAAEELGDSKIMFDTEVDAGVQLEKIVGEGRGEHSSENWSETDHQGTDAENLDKNNFQESDVGVAVAAEEVDEKLRESLDVVVAVQLDKETAEDEHKSPRWSETNHDTDSLELSVAAEDLENKDTNPTSVDGIVGVESGQATIEHIDQVDVDQAASHIEKEFGASSQINIQLNKDSVEIPKLAEDVAFVVIDAINLIDEEKSEIMNG